MPADVGVVQPSARPGRRLAAARGLGRLAQLVSRRAGLGSGGVIGGRIMLAVAPRAVRDLAAGREVLMVSGTNGKTTTSAYLTACLRTQEPVDSNADGANTAAGVAHTLAEGRARRVVLETDEGWLPWIAKETGAQTAVLLNLSRDQLHRHHEVTKIAVTWRDAVSALDHVVANADDPAVALAGLAAPRRTWVAAGNFFAEDTVGCPRCGAECRRDGGGWACVGCGLARPTPDWWLEGSELVGPGCRVGLRLALPGRANLANAAMAVATAADFGVDPQRAADAIADIDSVAGRYAVRDHHGRAARLVLAKNPAGWLEALNMVAGSDAPVVLSFNSEGVDGRDPSWLYDVPFTALAGRPIVVTGRRATDMLVRLELEGLTDLRTAADVPAALRTLPAGPVDVVANYTAFQEARKDLSRAG